MSRKMSLDGVVSTSPRPSRSAWCTASLASRGAKRLTERLLGARRRNAVYRPFYLGQSVVRFGALLLHIRRQRPSDVAPEALAR